MFDKKLPYDFFTGQQSTEFGYFAIANICFQRFEVFFSALHFIFFAFPVVANISFGFDDEVKLLGSIDILYNCPIRIIVPDRGRYNEPAWKFCIHFHTFVIFKFLSKPEFDF